MEAFSTTWQPHSISSYHTLALHLAVPGTCFSGCIQRLYPKVYCVILDSVSFLLLCLLPNFWLLCIWQWSLPTQTLVSFTEFRNCLFISSWLILFLVLPSGETHVDLWMSLCGNRDVVMANSFMSQNLQSLSPLAFCFLSPCLAITLLYSSFLSSPNVHVPSDNEHVIVALIIQTILEFHAKCTRNAVLCGCMIVSVMCWKWYLAWTIQSTRVPTAVFDINIPTPSLW